MAWSNSKTLAFLEMYQGERILWDPQESGHKDRVRINDAWLRISKAMDTPASDLKRKKESLMATFRNHQRKKKNSMRSGAGSADIYKPIWFAYETMEGFLGRLHECKRTVNTENTEEIVDVETIDEDISVMVNTNGEPMSSRGNGRQLNRRSRDVPLLRKAEHQIEKAFTALNDALTLNKGDEDECDLYCKLLATKLTKCPEDERRLLMLQIDKMFVNRHHNSNTAAPTVLRPDMQPSSSPCCANQDNQQQTPHAFHYNAVTSRSVYVPSEDILDLTMGSPTY